jgi:alkylation response protein AidB-like acyl-CoA dehydrogenase
MSGNAWLANLAGRPCRSEDHGGLGLGLANRAADGGDGGGLFCSPFFATVCLAVRLIGLGGSDEQKGEYLPAIAAGELTATLALTEASGRVDAAESGPNTRSTAILIC